MAVTAGTPIELVQGVYAKLPARVAIGRRRLGRPLTLTEKILINHLVDPETQGAHLDTPITDEPWDQRDPGSLEGLSLPNCGVGLVIFHHGNRCSQDIFRFDWK